MDPKYLNHNIDEYIESYLKNKVEGKCIYDGYVKPDSVRLLKRSAGILLGSRFTGDITYEIAYTAELCNPMEGNVYECKVKLINKTGICASNGPLTVIVGRQLHEDNLENFNKIQVGDTIKVHVIGKTFSLNDKEIKVVGKIHGMDNRKKKNVKNMSMEIVKKEDKMVDEEDELEDENDMDDIEFDDSEEGSEDNENQNSENESDEESEEEESDEEMNQVGGNTILKGNEFGDDFSEMGDNDVDDIDDGDDVGDDDDGDDGYYSD